MPIYEYECTKCEKRHEMMQKIMDKPLTDCPDCGGKLRKMISNTTFVLKGTGWYATDYGSNKSTNCESKTTKTAETKKEDKGTQKTETTSQSGVAAVPK